MPKPHDCICANCALTFELPAVAQCPYCHSRQVRRVDPAKPAEVVRALIQDALREGDTEAAECLQRVLDRFERPSVMAQAFDALAVRP
jgi:DNA-directed RNA polymerase subunit RPC12/RpoP